MEEEGVGGVVEGVGQLVERARGKEGGNGNRGGTGTNKNCISTFK